MKLFLRTALTLTLALPFYAEAGLFQVSCSGSNCSNSNVQAAIAELEAAVNRDLPDADASTYLKGMANSSVMANKSNGVDYANDIDLFVVGIGASVGADVGNNSFGDLISGDVDANQLRGVGIQPALMVGLDMGMFGIGEVGFINFDKLKLFANFFTYDLDQSDIKGDIFNFGIHGRYKYIDPISVVPGRMVYWTGVDFTAGFEYSTLDVSYTTRQSSSYTSGAVTATVDGTVKAGAKVSTVSIPVEVSTGVQLGYVFSTYAGLGVDLNFGSAEGNANVNATINDNIANTDLTGTMNLGQEDGPDTLTPRGFAGIQFNVPFVRIYAQVDRQIGADVWGAGAGLRVTW